MAFLRHITVRHCAPARLLTVVGAALLAAGFSVPAAAAFRDSFESTEPSWRASGHDVQYRVDAQQRVGDPVHSGRLAEYLRIAAGNGSRVYFAHDIPPAHVIDELGLSVWVKGDRPGIQLLARIVLPRTVDAKGQHLTALVRGSAYSQVGSWQQLSVTQLPRLVEREQRVLRAQYGAGVDARGAYVDRVLLNVYAGPGTTALWIDDLEATGVASIGPAATGGPAVPGAAEAGDGWHGSGSTFPVSSQRRLDASRVALRGSTLEVAGRPFFPRMIEYRGESLEYLATLGFNAIKLDGRASATLLADAQRAGLWVVAAPPPPAALEGNAAAQRELAADRILAWSLGEGLGPRDVEPLKTWARLVKAGDPAKRPTLCDAAGDLKTFSRHVDIIAPRRFPVGGSLEVASYAQWLRTRPQLARLGTPYWTVIQTEPLPAVVEQLRLMHGEGGAWPALEHEQIRQLVLAAVSAGARGLCFQSSERLDGGSSAGQLRAAALELVNLELQLIEPWCAGGKFTGVVQSSDAQVVGAILQTDHARLLLPLAAAPASRCALASSGEGSTSFVIPGVPESNRAFRLTAAGMKPLATQRAAGGIRIALTAPERMSLVVLTPDDLVVQALSRRSAKIALRGAELELRLSAARLALVDEVRRQFGALGTSTALPEAWITAARSDHSAARTLYSAAKAADAFERAHTASWRLSVVERAAWESLGAAQITSGGIPSAFSFATLPLCARWKVESARFAPTGSAIRAGDFESLEAMLSAGWRHYEHPQSGIMTSVELAAPGRSGRLALHLRALPAKAGQAPSVVESSPLWVTTAPVELVAGDRVELSMWVQVPRAIEGSVDGLEIVDSITGEPLAQRVTATRGWQEIRIYRVAPRAGRFWATLALTGLGEAWVDDVALRRLDPPATSRPAADWRAGQTK